MKNNISAINSQTGTFKKVLALLCIISMMSCNEDFLERKPKGQLTYDTFFETPDHAVWATNAIYQQFRSREMMLMTVGTSTVIIS